jgi:hypothetical protein
VLFLKTAWCCLRDSRHLAADSLSLELPLLKELEELAEGVLALIWRLIFTIADESSQNSSSLSAP